LRAARIIRQTRPSHNARDRLAIRVAAVIEQEIAAGLLPGNITAPIPGRFRIPPIMR
jgi:hypothetical protein